MLIWFVALYLLASIAIGLFAATRVHNAKDFAVAGRSLPLPVVTATVFATWFVWLLPVFSTAPKFTSSMY